jgi:hypothetical protein
MMKAKVYLQEGRDSMFWPFDPATANLRLAAEFELSESEVMKATDAVRRFGILGDDAVVRGLLEMIFEQLNVGGDLVPATEWTEEYRANRNRSLSVGDVVTIGETAWAVARFGWDQISGEAITSALNKE